MLQIVLASASPRRKELFSLLGYPFIVYPPRIEETISPDWPPHKISEELALQKAEALRPFFDKNLIVSADTSVILDNQIFGKPCTMEEAKDFLHLLSGRTHQVYTGVCILPPDHPPIQFSVRTDVTFFELSSEEIDAYVSTGEPMDKAGGYGIQGKGALLVKEITGDYYNVVGLPIALLSRQLTPFLAL